MAHDRLAWARDALANLSYDQMMFLARELHCLLPDDDFDHTDVAAALSELALTGDPEW